MKKVILTCDKCKKSDDNKEDEVTIYEVTPLVNSFFKLIHHNYNINHLCKKCWLNNYPNLMTSSTITEPKQKLLMLPVTYIDDLEEILTRSKHSELT